MGWTFGWKTKKDLVRKLTENHANEYGTWTVVAAKLVGNELWTVKDIVTEGFTGRVIHVDLLEVHGEWGYKDLSECMGPYAYTCPLEFLELVPVVANQDWRDKVRAFHAAQKGWA